MKFLNRIKIVCSTLYAEAERVLFKSVPVVTAALNIIVFRYMTGDDREKFSTKTAISEAVIGEYLLANLASFTEDLAYRFVQNIFSTPHKEQPLVRRFKLGLVKELILDALPLTVTIGIVVIVKYSMLSDKEEFSLSNAVYEGIGGSFLMSNLLNQPISKLCINLSRKMLPPHLASPSLRDRINLGNKYSLLKPHLADAYKETIEASFRQWDSDREAGYSGMNVDKLKTKIEALLNLPHKRRNAIPAELFHKELKPQLLALIEEYDEAFKQQLKDFIMNIIHHINNTDILDSANNHRLKPVFFQGEPGVGKTTFTENLCKILSIPCVKIKLSANQTVDELNGGSAYSDCTKLGIVIESLLKAERSHQSDTVIILFDEIDKLFHATSDKQGQISYIKSWLLDLLNSDITEISSEALGVKINIKNIMIVMTGNRNFIKHFREEADTKAFNDRVKIYCFPPFNKAALVNIGNKFYKKLIEQSSFKPIESQKVIINLKELELDVVSKYENQTIIDIIMQYYLEPHLDAEYQKKQIDTIIHSNTHPGVRIMQDVITAYIKHAQKKDYFNEFCPDRFDIKAAYQFYRSIEQNTNKDEKNAKEKSDMVELATATLPVSPAVGFVDPANPASIMSAGNSPLTQKQLIELYKILKAQVSKTKLGIETNSTQHNHKSEIADTSKTFLPMATIAIGEKPATTVPQTKSQIGPEIQP